MSATTARSRGAEGRSWSSCHYLDFINLFMLLLQLFGDRR